MTVGLGGAHGARFGGTTTALGVAWLAAGAAALVGAGLGRGNSVPAAALELVGGVLVVTSAALAYVPLGPAPGAVTIAAAHGVMLSQAGRRVRPEAETHVTDDAERERARRAA